MNGQVDGQMDGWMNGWMDKWMDGRMDGWTNGTDGQIKWQLAGTLGGSGTLGGWHWLAHPPMAVSRNTVEGLNDGTGVTVSRAQPQARRCSGGARG